MYIVPQKSTDAPLIELNCVCFPRSGEWAGAVMKFRIELPMAYPQSLNEDRLTSFPEVVFEQLSDNKLKHAMIDELMGFVDLSDLKS